MAGALLFGVAPERFVRGNEIIVQILSDLGYDIDRMVTLLRQEGLRPPSFIKTANGFRVTVWGHAEALPEAQTGPNHWRWSGLNPRQELGLRFLQDHEQITHREHQTLCPDVSPETLRRDLAELVHCGLLLRIGDKRATYYVLR